MKCLIVGTISNSAKNFEQDYRRLKKVFKQFGESYFYVVESDSSDRTLQTLNKIKLDDTNFNFISLGHLRHEIPNRIERIRFCRNQYVDQIRKSQDEHNWDLIVVADMDGMNTSLNSSGVNEVLSNTEWGACFANQTFGYYDIMALRSSGWVERDCFLELESLKLKNSTIRTHPNRFVQFLIEFSHFDNLRKIAIYNKMIRIDRNSHLIAVRSAFGGLGLYKPDLFLKYDYDLLNLEEAVYSEHVDFHYKAIEGGHKLFIAPKLINSHVNEYNINRLASVRFLRELKKFFQSL